MFFLVVILSLLFVYIKQNEWFLKKKNYFFIILVDLYASLSRFCFGTRIQINVSWYGSGQMIRIRPDPDPKHWIPGTRYSALKQFTLDARQKIFADYVCSLQIWHNCQQIQLLSGNISSSIPGFPQISLIQSTVNNDMCAEV